MSARNPIDPKLPTLVSFTLCPYVQRSVIAMQLKGQSFERVYIDLNDKPSWFTDKVPTGKVPALFIDGEVIFESYVINEFLDESFGEALLSPTPLDRARERSWSIFSDSILGAQYRLSFAQTEEDYKEHADAFKSAMLRIGEVARGPYFNGDKLCLADTVVAPIFTRLALMPSLQHEIFSEGSSAADTLARWSEALLALPEIRNSVAKDFETIFREFFTERNSYFLTI